MYRSRYRCERLLGEVGSRPLRIVYYNKAADSSAEIKTLWMKSIAEFQTNRVESWNFWLRKQFCLVLVYSKAALITILA
ncbi:hypothetical protein J6590_011264 [Homalodisca vitripennis]|nr:hypothetical protein J6590_011264 [Homalodisca vitripennis]